MSDVDVISVERSLSTGSLKSHLLNGSLRLLYLSLFLLFPFHEVFYHFVIKNRIGAGSVLLYPEHLLLIFLAVVFRGDLVRAVRRWKIEMGLLAVYTVAFWVSSLSNPVDPDYAFRVFLVSIVFPALLVLLLTIATDVFGLDAVNDGVLFLFTGVVSVCAVGLVAYPASFGLPRDFHQFVYGFRTGIALEGVRAGIWYGELTAGNFNVFASLLLPAVFLVYGWYLAKGEGRPRAGLAAALMLLVLGANLYICYSRGAILVLNACAAFFCLAARLLGTRIRRLIPLAIGVMVFDLLVITPKGAVAYWASAFQARQDNSVRQRLEQWEDVSVRMAAGTGGGEESPAPEAVRRPPSATLRSRASRLLLGRGIGNYGVSRGLTTSANTHNLFLNQLVAIGLVGFLAFAGLFLLTLARGWTAVRRGGEAGEGLRLGGWIGLMAIALIGIVTQYEFEYLGTMTGGAVFWTCAFFSRWNGGNRAAARVREDEPPWKPKGQIEEVAQSGQSNAAPDVFVLSVYPISGGFLERIGLRDARPLLLSQLRGGGLVATVRRLRRVRETRGIAVIETEDAAPFVPVLLSLLLFTRCGHLQLVGPSAQPRTLSRLDLLRSLGEVLAGTFQGIGAVCLQYASAWRALVASRSKMGEEKLTGPWLYLRSNLWFGLMAGGSVGHVAGVINALHRRGTRLTILSSGRPPMVDSSVPFLGLPPVGSLGFPYELNNYRLDRLAARFTIRGHIVDPDIIYHRLGLGSIAAVLLSRRLRAGLILEYNGSEAWVARHWGRGLKLYGLARLCEDVCLRHAHALVVVSEVLKEECMARGVPSGRVIVHPNGIDPAVFDPSRFPPERLRTLRQSLGIPPQAVVLTFLGTYGMWHGAEVFAQAARRLILNGETGEDSRPLFFLFVGDGLRMPDVRGAFADLPGEVPVRYTGLVAQHRAPEHLAASDVLVSPHVPNPDGSRFFGSPTKLFEYMAMGKAIAASDLEQIGQVLANSYRSCALPSAPAASEESRLAVLAPPGDVEELVRALRFLARRPDYRRILGENARREALRRYTWDAAIEHILQELPRALRS